eukprot:Blabericola_migrator_1__7436@NODE_378_length_9209_cov_129_909101_g302_i0_p5_GENE_NODE_378_length_9209_cov_129_909101_g302_i0NODE_378_length_9209_cov_129_909101_g302_i0_p5_ORF_typecomplete_len289_score39_35Mito_carr/PF00153_27/91Mito_carr/PF00153_27/27Mito_carr/PF00153_27/9_8_NODE_378_length_9209_cov_129_909101_g302_i042265092
MQTYLDKPLTQREEARLSTLGNCITLACFRPLDTYKQVVRKSKVTGSIELASLWKGWPKQAFNKALDDEVFNSNIRRVNKFVEDTFNYKNPSKTPVGKALVGTAARALTLTIMVPYQQVSDRSKRKVLVEKRKNKEVMTVSLIPLYTGFERSLIKESVFTSSYILLSAYFGNVFARQRPLIEEQVQKCLPKIAEQDENRAKVTDITVASLRAAAAGACASLLSQPIDMAGKGIPFSKQVTIASRKAFRKGCYNGINTFIVQGLYLHKIHRRLFWTMTAPTVKEAPTKA